MEKDKKLYDLLINIQDMTKQEILVIKEFFNIMSKSFNKAEFKKRDE